MTSAGTASRMEPNVEVGMSGRALTIATDSGGTFSGLVCFEADPRTSEQMIRTVKTDTTPWDDEKGVPRCAAEGQDFAGRGSVLHTWLECRGTRGLRR